MTASENLRVLSDAANFHGPASESRRLLEESAGDAALLLARALDALAGFRFDARCGVKPTTLAVLNADAILADADRLFGDNTEKEE